MELSNTPVERFPLAEFLESRCLLSGAAPLEIGGGDANAAAVVQVLELDVADERDDENLIDPSALPAAVLAALDARFPGAALTEAEVDEDDGEVTYGVLAEFNGETIDATLTPDGGIVEVEQVVSSDQLPKAVLDWLRNQYPGAEIDEAAVVDDGGDGVKIEVTFRPPGQQPLEASLGLDTSPSTGTFPTVIRPPEQDNGIVAAARSAAFSSVFAAASSLTLPGADADESIQEYVVSLADEAAASNVDRSILAAFDHDFPARQAKLLTEALSALVAGTGAVAVTDPWLPQLAGALSELPSMNAAAVEQALRDILAQVDEFADNVTEGITFSADTTRLLTAALLFATVRILFELRKPKGHPVLASDITRSSWSWVLGRPRRRRR